MIEYIGTLKKSKGSTVMTDNELEIMKQGMRRPGKAASQILRALRTKIREGITGIDINNFIETLIKKRYPQYRLSSKGYNGFPASSCISINDGIVHGIPSDRKINNGDLVKVDIVLDYKGWYADTAMTYIVGHAGPDETRMVRVVREALDKAIQAAVPGNTIGDIGYIVQTHIETEGFSVMRDYCGHGIGRKMHLPPNVPNFGIKGEGQALKKGMAIAIEPMAFMGKPDVHTAQDGWTVVSNDHSLTAHFEHTVLIMSGDPVVITK
jgi:methionyl aminopeptidase